MKRTNTAPKPALRDAQSLAAKTAADEEKAAQMAAFGAAIVDLLSGGRPKGTDTTED